MSRYRQTLSALLVFLVSAFYFGYALVCIDSRSIRGVPDSAFIPKIVGFLMVALSCVLLVLSFLKERKLASTQQQAQHSQEKKEFLNVMGTAGILLAYILLIQPLGFLLSTVLYLFAQFLYLTDKAKLKQKKTYLLYLFIAICTATSVYYLFLNVFHLILPAGILG